MDLGGVPGSIIDMLDLDKRAVLVMYEIEGIECDRIAALAAQRG